jgi:hypothetical protein
MPLNNFSKLELHGDHIDVYGWTDEVPTDGSVLQIANVFVVVQDGAVAIGEKIVDATGTRVDWDGTARVTKGQFTKGMQADVQGVGILIKATPPNAFDCVGAKVQDLAPPPPWSNTLAPRVT